MKRNLESALSRRNVVRIRRRFDRSSIHGFVSGLSERFVLVTIVSDRIWFDGFEVFRVRDILDVVDDPREDFVARALRRRRQRKPTIPNLDLTKMQTIIRSACNASIVVTIHHEEADPGICHIGRVVSVTSKSVSLQLIDSSARWHTTATLFKTAGITRIGMGADYEKALTLVGGAPPAIPAMP